MAALEYRAVDELLAFLDTEVPTKPQIQRAQVALGSFASIQRRLSAQNQRDYLEATMTSRRSERPALAGGQSSSGREG